MAHEVLRAVCDAAGWTFCEEHKRPKWHGVAPCGPRYHRSKPKHFYLCPWPEDDCWCGLEQGARGCAALEDDDA